jgi:hypothetical protein
MWLHRKIYKGFINLTPQVENSLHQMVSYDRMNISIDMSASLYGYMHTDEVITIALIITLTSSKALYSIQLKTN